MTIHISLQSHDNSISTVSFNLMNVTFYKTKRCFHDRHDKIVGHWDRNLRQTDILILVLLSTFSLKLEQP